MREPQPRSQPLDQADGLRRLFGSQRKRYVALAHNPHVAFGGVVIERLTAAFAQRGLHTLVVDAADTAVAPHELARVDLAACVDAISPQVSFLAARGLPMRHVDTRGSASAFLDAVAAAVPRADVVLLHANASDLTRLFHGRTVRPVLMAGRKTESLTEAYAGMKLLTQRLGVIACDLLVAADAGWPHAAMLAERLASCADRFLGTSLHDWASLDPAEALAPPSAALSRLALGQLAAEIEPSTQAAAGWEPPHTSLPRRSAERRAP